MRRLCELLWRQRELCHNEIGAGVDILVALVILQDSVSLAFRVMQTDRRRAPMPEMATIITSVASLVVAVGALVVFVGIFYLVVRLGRAIELLSVQDGRSPADGDSSPQSR